jgi:hypothetical protein
LGHRRIAGILPALEWIYRESYSWLCPALPKSARQDLVSRQASRNNSLGFRNLSGRRESNPRLEPRIKEAEAIRFQRRHEEAVESVMRAGEKSWMTHAWYLERVLPNLPALA